MVSSSPWQSLPSLKVSWFSCSVKSPHERFELKLITLFSATVKIFRVRNMIDYKSVCVRLPTFSNPHLVVVVSCPHAHKTGEETVTVHSDEFIS
jgi:hypothetical protein